MRKIITISILAILVAFTGIVGFTLLTDTPTTPVTQSVAPTIQKPQPPTVDELLRLVNEERAKVGVAPLRLDPLLNQSAQRKADDMYKNNYFGHVDANGKHGYEYVIEAGKKCIYQSENLRDNDKSVNTAAETMSAWINSKPHYTAMIDSRFESTGFGISGDKITEHFCDER